MKIRSSTKIFAGFVVVCAGLYFGYHTYSSQAIAGTHFDPVTPGKVNFVGIDPGSGYQIIVANEMAQLVEAEGGFQGKETDSGGATAGSIKKRIPVREMLGVFQGNTDDLGKFVMIMNDMTENDSWPSQHIVWTAENLRKAMDGDPALVAKLQSDLNMKLDGTPLPTLRTSALANGIIVDFPVTLTVKIEGKDTPVTGRVQKPYKPRMIRAVEEQIADKQATPTMMAGYYAQEAKQAIAHPDKREDIRQQLESMIAPAQAQLLRKAPEQVLQYAEVVVNENQIKSARYQGSDEGVKRSYEMTVNLSDEGQKRLWKYSMNRVGSHLLIIVDGVAIAAPKIQHELTQDELTIRGMKDETLVKDATNELNHANQVAKT